MFCRSRTFTRIVRLYGDIPARAVEGQSVREMGSLQHVLSSQLLFSRLSSFSFHNTVCNKPLWQFGLRNKSTAKRLMRQWTCQGSSEGGGGRRHVRVRGGLVPHAIGVGLHRV